MDATTQDSAKALVIYNKKLLLLLRDNIPTIVNPNTWSVVGGGVEKGETFLQAVIREMEEEICIAPKDTRYLGKLKAPKVGYFGIFVVYPTEEEVEKIRLGNEGQKLDFFTIEEMEHLTLGKELAAYFQTYKEYLRRVISDGEEVDPTKLGLISG